MGRPHTNDYERMQAPMKRNLKIIGGVTAVLAVLFLSSCQSSPMPAPTAAPAEPILKTTLGDFRIVSARLADEVHDSQAPDGQKFLLIGLVRPDLQKLIPGEFSLEAFQTMMVETSEAIYIQGDDGSQTFYSHMGGWVEEDFVIGFTVPVSKTYTLHWPGNDPLPLTITE